MLPSLFAICSPCLNITLSALLSIRWRPGSMLVVELKIGSHLWPPGDTSILTDHQGSHTVHMTNVALTRKVIKEELELRQRLIPNFSG